MQGMGMPHSMALATTWPSHRPKMMEGQCSGTLAKVLHAGVKRTVVRRLEVEGLFRGGLGQLDDQVDERVLAVADSFTSAGPRNVVAISAGARDGVDNGTVFSVWRVGSNVVDRVQVPERDGDFVSNADKVRLPDEFAGHVMVFRTFDKISYGLVMDSIRPTRVGHELKHPDATY